MTRNLLRLGRCLALALSVAVLPTGLAPAASAASGVAPVSAPLRKAQLQLAWLSLNPGKRTGTYTPQTVAALEHFQEKFQLPVSGVVEPQTAALLKQLTTGPGVDPRCRRPGKVLCIDKSQRILRAFENGTLIRSTDARFGRPGMKTREGSFRVFRKSRDHLSKEWGGAMPYAMFFSGGQAVHFSADFARQGYAGASHGCVNIRALQSIAWLWDWTPVGTRVVVYAS